MFALLKTGESTSSIREREGYRGDIRRNWKESRRCGSRNNGEPEW
jgi:hypothetical protein